MLLELQHNGSQLKPQCRRLWFGKGGVVFKDEGGGFRFLGCITVRMFSALFGGQYKLSELPQTSNKASARVKIVSTVFLAATCSCHD